MSKELNWAKTGTVGAMAAWLRSKSDALCVVVIRRDDAVLAADGLLAPSDARDLVVDRMPELAANLTQSRKEKKSSARVELGEMHE
jgi:hypothetical protein